MAFDELKPVADAVRLAIRSASPPISIKEVGEQLGIKESIFRNMVNARTRIPENALEELRKLLKMSPGWPQQSAAHSTDAPDTPGGITRKMYSLAGTPLAPVKIVGNISAGEGIYNVDFDTQEIFLPERLRNLGGIAFIVDGDSMMSGEPHTLDLRPGDITLFKESRQPRNGIPMLLKDPQNAFRVKTLRWDASSSRWVQHSKNPNYPDEPMDNLEIVGFLIGWYSAKGTRESLESDPLGLSLD